MERSVIHHRPRPLSSTLIRHLEIEAECPDCPPDSPKTVATCPECGSTMAYRGLGRLRGGSRVHYFECVHSHREVHSVSIIIDE